MVELVVVVVESIGSSPAVLLKNHGVFTIGASGEAALKAAVMVEDIARTVWLAKQIGEPMEIPGVGMYVSFMDTEDNRVSLLKPIMPGE